MKKLILLLLFIPLVSFGQTVLKSTTNTNISSETNIENELVLSDENTTIKTPLTTDLSNYTHLLIIDATLYSDWAEDYVGWRNEFIRLENLLSLTVFEVMNPYRVDRKRFRKESNFLRTMKNDSYLYLYLRQAAGRGDDVNTSIIIRDSKNKIIYNATHINTGLNEVLAPLIDY